MLTGKILTSAGWVHQGTDHLQKWSRRSSIIMLSRREDKYWQAVIFYDGKRIQRTAISKKKSKALAALGKQELYRAAAHDTAKGFEVETYIVSVYDFAKGG